MHVRVCPGRCCASDVVLQCDIFRYSIVNPFEANLYMKPRHKKHSHLGLKQKVDVPGEPRKIYFGYFIFDCDVYRAWGASFGCVCLSAHTICLGSLNKLTWAIFRPRRLFIFYRAWGAFFRQRYVSEIIISSPPQPISKKLPRHFFL